VQKKRSFPRFVVKEMESAYVDELKASINLLMANLESLPVTKGSNAESKYSLQKFKKYSKYARAERSLRVVRAVCVRSWDANADPTTFDVCWVQPVIGLDHVVKVNS